MSPASSRIFGQLLEPFERAGRVLAEQVPRLVDVDLGELAGWVTFFSMFSSWSRSPRVSSSRPSAHLQRVVAAKFMRWFHGMSGETPVGGSRQLVDLPPEVEILQQRLREALELPRAAQGSSS